MYKQEYICNNIANNKHIQVDIADFLKKMFCG